MTTLPQTESPAQRDARFAFERAKKRRDDLCRLQRSCYDLIVELDNCFLPNIANAQELVKVLLNNRMAEIGIEDPTEEVCAYIMEKPVCRICALSDVNCKCSRDDIRLDSSALAERG